MERKLLRVQCPGPFAKWGVKEYLPWGDYLHQKAWRTFGGMGSCPSLCQMGLNCLSYVLLGGDEEQQSLAQLCNSHYWFPISCLNCGWSSTFHRPFNRLNSLWGADGPQRRLSTSIGSTNVSSMEKNHPLQSAVHVPLNLQPVRHIIMYCSHNYRRGIHSQHVVRQML